MFARKLPTVLLLGLAACTSGSYKAEPGQFSGFEDVYRRVVTQELSGPRWAAMPPDVKDMMINCMARYMKATVGPDGLAELDAAFSGEHEIPDEEAARLIAKIDARDFSGMHVWSNAELDARARELGWGSFQQVTERYAAQGSLSPANEAADKIAGFNQFLRNATRDGMRYLSPYCPTDVAAFKEY